MPRNTDKTLDEIAIDILADVYEEADPSLDFRDALNNPDFDPSDYELPKKRQKEIMDEHLNGMELTDREYTSLLTTVVLDYGPHVTMDDDSGGDTDGA